MATREEEFREVRRLLGDPRENAPTPDMIVSQLIREEQKMLNDLGLTGKGWTVSSDTFTTVADQAEYELATQGLGRVLFAYRDLGNGVLRTVPFTDYQSEIDNQSYEYIVVPATSGAAPEFSGEKLAFFRSGQGGVAMVRVFPVPEGGMADLVYTYVFARGALDWSSFTWSDTPILPEWSYYKTTRAAMFLVDRSEWEGFSRADNMDQRKMTGARLLGEFQLEDSKWEAYIRNPQLEPAGDSGYWWE